MDLTLARLRRQFAAAELSPVELTEDLLARAAGSTAFAALDPEGALAAARAAERAHHAGTAGPLAGVPVAVQDLVETAGVVTACGSAMLADRVPSADAPVVAVLRAAGAVILGKTRTHEFAWGVTSEATGLGPCRNPHDPERVAGGSSGGSGVAVAEGLCSFAVGTDTAGSVRVPAAFCGVVGLKPTFGTLPVSGVWPLAPSFDTVGVLASTVTDARVALGVLGGAVGAQPPVGRLGTDVPAGQRRVGLLRQPFQPPLGDAVAAAIDGLGVTVVDLPLSVADDPTPAFAVVQGAEALAVHRARGLYPDRADGYDPQVRARLDAAAERSPETVAVARAQLAQLRAAMDAALATVDVALAPIHAVVAPRIGEADDLRAAVLPFTIPQSVAGVPACAVPAGRAGGLPVGVQVCAARGADAEMLAAAHELGSSATWPS